MVWTAGDALTAAQLNAYIPQAFTAYTPALSGWTLGNGTLTGTYWQSGKLVIARLSFTYGSTTTTSGDMVISLPATAAISAGFSGGNAHILDTSAVTRFNRHAFISSATQVRFATEQDVRVNATSPMTWATGDTLIAQLTYEAA